MISQRSNFILRNLLSFSVAFLSGTIGGSLAAFVLGLIPIHIYVVYPAIIGFIAASCAVYAWHRLKSSKGWIITLACFLSGLVSYISFHWWDYFILLLNYNSSVQQILFQETGHNGFWGFLLLNARQSFSGFGVLRGMPIHTSSKGESIPLLHWLMWSLDFFVALICSFFYGLDASSDKEIRGQNFIIKHSDSE